MIDESKLNKCVEKDGKTVAQCPACAEKGKDNTGNHLTIFPDGKFTCILHHGDSDEDKEHRSRIWQLAGDGRPFDSEGQSTLMFKLFPVEPLPIEEGVSVYEEILNFGTSGT